MFLHKEIITNHRMRKVWCRCDWMPNINLEERYSRSWVPDWTVPTNNLFILIYYSLFLIVSQTTNLFSALALYLAAKYFLCLNLSSVCFPYASDCQKTAPLRYVLYLSLVHVGIWPNLSELVRRLTGMGLCAVRFLVLFGRFTEVRSVGLFVNFL